MILEKSWWSFLVVVVSIVIAVVIVVRGHSVQFMESNLLGMRGHRGRRRLWPNPDLQRRLHLLSARNALMVLCLYRLEHCL